uniref:SNRNP25 ubiquitin-like domain-containing protein n=1 Tax=Manihot esculenta TaxID=3983 RepID=A0A2C9WHT5_MANES
MMEKESISKGGEDIGYKCSNVKKAKLQSTLAALLDDPILADVPRKPTLTDVDILTSLEFGSAIRISILKLDGTSFVIEMEQSKMRHRHISW